MPKRYKNSWTPEEDQLLKKCVSEGMISKEIAPLLPNRSFHAITSRRASLKLKRPSVVFPKSDPATVAQIVKFRMAGWRLVDIERVTGVTPERLCKLVCDAGIRGLRPVHRKHAKRKPPWTELELVSLRRCLQRKMPMALLRYEFPNRTEFAIKKKASEMKRYWLSDAEKEKRRRQREKQWRVY